MVGSNRRYALWGILLIACLFTSAAVAARPSYQYEALAYLGARSPEGGAYRGAFLPAAIGAESDVLYVAGVGSRGAQGLFLDTLDAVVPIVAPGADAGEGWRFAEQPGKLGGIPAPIGMARSGNVAFAADLERDDQTGSGVFRWERETQTLTPVALPGRVAPGRDALGDAGPGVAIDPAGFVLFAAALQSQAVAGRPSADGLFRYAAGELLSFVMPGDPEPGGGRFMRARHPSVNEAGQIAFEAEVEREGRRTWGIFVADGPRLKRMAEVGAALPGGETLRAVREPRINERGEVVFFGDAGEWAVYLAREGRVTRLVGPGAALPDGDRVGEVATRPGALTVSRDQTALVLHLEEAGAAGVFLLGPNGLSPVALPRTFLAGVGPMDSVGDAVAVNDEGQVAFQAELADGEVALVLATPVPGGG